jgi:hypothetical protein
LAERGNGFQGDSTVGESRNATLSGFKALERVIMVNQRDKSFRERTYIEEVVGVKSHHVAGDRPQTCLRDEYLRYVVSIGQQLVSVLRAQIWVRTRCILKCMY